MTTPVFSVLAIGLLITALFAADLRGLFSQARSGLLGIPLLPMAGLAGLGS